MGQGCPALEIINMLAPAPLSDAKGLRLKEETRELINKLAAEMEIKPATLLRNIVEEWIDEHQNFIQTMLKE